MWLTTTLHLVPWKLKALLSHPISIFYRNLMYHLRTIHAGSFDFGCVFVESCHIYLWIIDSWGTRLRYPPSISYYVHSPPLVQGGSSPLILVMSSFLVILRFQRCFIRVPSGKFSSTYIIAHQMTRSRRSVLTMTVCGLHVCFCYPRLSYL